MPPSMENHGTGLMSILPTTRSKSFMKAEVPPSPDVIIAGAGLIGMTSALKLQQLGYRVRVMDRSEPGRGASFGNAGYLATELIDPLSTPETLCKAPRLLIDPHGPLSLPPRYLPTIAPWLVRFALAARRHSVDSGRTALAALNASSVAAWQRCLGSIGAADELIASGYLTVWEKPGGLGQAREKQRKLRQYGIESEILGHEEVHRRDPGLSQAIQHALLFPNAYQVSDPYRVVQRLVAAFRQAGGEIVEASVEDIRVIDDGVVVTSDRGEVNAKHVIVALGAWSRQLASKLELDMPLETERGHHLTLSGRLGALRQPIGSAERNVVMTPMQCGLRIVGFSELGGLFLPPSAKRYRTLKHHAAALLADGSGLENADEWMGFRPTLPDSLPVIGKHPKHSQVQFAFGHQHLGLTQAAITAELNADILMNKTPQIDIHPFRPDRFNRH